MAVQIQVAERARVGLRRETSAFDSVGFLRRLDWVLLAAAFALIGYGLWVVGGITRFDVPGDPNYYVVRQAVAAVLGLGALVFATIVPYDLALRYWRLVYCTTLGLMLIVFVAAETIRGSKRWINLGVIQFQPSELGKVLFVLALAAFLVERAGRITRWRTIMSAIGLGAVPILLVFLQPDLGTALVYSAALFSLLFFVGVRWRQLLVLFVAATFLALAVLWVLPASGVQVLKPYQAHRFTGFLNRDRDPGGLTWNVNQSTRLDYLPEHATDFAFASLGEQRGFVGSAILLLLYLLVVWRGLRVVTVAGDLFGAVVAGGLVFAFLFQIFINAGMTMGVAPVTGIPLPFVAVGGTSIVSNLFLIGVLQGIHARGNLGRLRP